MTVLSLLLDMDDAVEALHPFLLEHHRVSGVPLERICDAVGDDAAQMMPLGLRYARLPGVAEQAAVLLARAALGPDRTEEGSRRGFARVHERANEALGQVAQEIRARLAVLVPADGSGA